MLWSPLPVDMMDMDIAGPVQGANFDSFFSKGDSGASPGLSLPADASAGLKDALGGATDAVTSAQDAATAAASSIAEGVNNWTSSVPLKTILPCHAPRVRYQ